MQGRGRLVAALACAALWAAHAQAQTADDIIEKHLAALGGRDQLAKLQTRVSHGTITVSAQGADISGPIEIYNKRPNKSRTHFSLDLSQFGADSIVVDQRFDGATAFAGNSMQGDRDLTGNQLQNMKNGSFPTAFLTYKDTGTTVELAGREKVGDREAFVIHYTPKAGSPSRQYFDAETYLLLRMVMKVDSPELGGEIEQTTDLLDYREVDGVKVPFGLRMVNSAQAMTISFNTVVHNKDVDDALFVRPAIK